MGFVRSEGKRRLSAAWRRDPPTRVAPGRFALVYRDRMPLQGEYEPGTLDWSRKQADLIEASGGTEGTEMNGMGVIVVTSVGNKTGKLRTTPLMRVEHEGRYA